MDANEARGASQGNMHEFHTRMNCTSWMDELSKRCIVLGGFQKRVVNFMFESPKLLEDVSGILKM